MDHIYAIVLTDEKALGFEEFTELLNRRLTTGGVGVYWVSNPRVPSGPSDDFHVIVLQGGSVPDALDADDRPHTRMENLRLAVCDADSVLRALHERVQGTEVGADLETVLDRWDEFAGQFNDTEYVAPGFEES